MQDWAVGLLEIKPNRSDSSEPNRFSAVYKYGRDVFFTHFSQSFSFFSISRERFYLLSRILLLSPPSSPQVRTVPVRWLASQGGGATASDVKMSLFF